MNKLLIATLIAGSFISFQAKAGERVGDAALGALSGAVVLGPVGAVAGAFVGYSAGPSIARSWGLRRSASSPRARRAATRYSSTTQVTADASSPPPSARAAEARPAARRAPPVQPLE
ncbi:DNA-directed RNA polymerase subunit N [Bradyrhizobium lablabi]|jgi:hypothetical protein|uniref:DNA-directed RNA polymerase subunit N n=1 Tax=Bradyrhizobium lablabi TaxID=722472 RepID=UPI001BA897B9|nr:DNA-directed RNA polymerase subunit N [Bradyrhizobium lablabi]MBR1120078.1 DNA-directed RNA polymerase subunit N [Bradyrhizobium lablabi]